jgi:thiol:disulfide interchange protein DsbD
MIASRQRIFFILALVALLPTAAWASPWKAVDEGLETRFSMELEKSELRPGAVTTLTIGFQVQDGWYVEGPTSENSPMRVGTSDESILQILGQPSGPEGKKVYDDVLEKNLVKHVGEVRFTQRVRVNPAAERGTHEITLRVDGQTCNKGSCRKLRNVLLASTLTIAGDPVETKSSDDALLSSAGGLPDDGSEPVTSAWAFLVACFLGGLAMLLLPCVWPMIPITISIFVKHSEENNTGALFYALVYGFGIVASFGLIGLAIGFWLPPSYAQSIATSGPLNLVIGILFVAFALSFFGMFELKVPDFIQRRMPQGNAGQGMIVASLLMGVLFTITSFACTAPIMGTILVAGTSTGDKWMIPLGMGASGLGVAIPFVALAIFPSTLKKMPRAGGWMNTIKVVLGFVELAAALKFLSNADLAWDTQILTWPVFMCLWIAIMFSLSFYLFGWVRMGHDTGDGTVSVGRFTFGMLVSGMAIYLVFGLFHPDEPMPSVVAAMTPPHEYGRPHLKNQELVDGEPSNALYWYDDWDKASAAAIQSNKAIFVDFTGVQCTNCRLVEKRVFPRVEETLRKFVVVKLYTDYGSSKDRNIELRDRYSRDLPYYVVLSPDTKTVLARQRYTDSPKEFQAFLDKGLKGLSAMSAGETRSQPESVVEAPPAFKWHHSMEEAKAAQKENPRTLFVAFGGKYCKPCKEMAKTVFKDPAVEAIFKGFILAELETQDGDDMDQNLALLDEIAGSDEVPFYVLFDTEGQVVTKLKGRKSVGAFVNFLNQGVAP